MGCLPLSGGCERERVEPFVLYLNKLENSNFSHKSCLDINIRDTPQPEALYVDEKTKKNLVIERKSLIWPLNYVAKHKLDHLLAELLLEKLKNISTANAYGIHLDESFSGNEQDVVNFADRIVQGISSNIDLVNKGKKIGSKIKGRRWVFTLEEPSMREVYGEPITGLVVRWDEIESLDEEAEISNHLINKVKDIFQSCEKKFKTYSDARRILIIQSMGHIDKMSYFWWDRLFSVATPTSGIDEIWRGNYEWVTDNAQDWIFEKLFPTQKSKYEPFGDIF